MHEIDVGQIARLILFVTVVYVTRVCASVQPEPYYNANGRPGELAKTADVHARAVTDQPLSMTVEFDMADGDEGVLLMASSQSEAFVLYVESGKAILRYQYILDSSGLVISSAPLPSGHVRLRYEFYPESWTKGDQRGHGNLFVNDSEVKLKANTLASNGRAEHDDAILERTFTGKITGAIAKGR